MVIPPGIVQPGLPPWPVALGGFEPPHNFAIGRAHRSGRARGSTELGRCWWRGEARCGGSSQQPRTLLGSEGEAVARSGGDDAASALEVVVVGGGAIGLFLSLVLASSARGRRRTRVYDRRWSRQDGSVGWRSSGEGGSSSTARFVSLDSRFWTSLPDALQEELFPLDTYARQWPSEQSAGELLAHPRSVDLRDLEARLLQAVQSEPYASSIELCPEAYTREEHERLTAESPFHAIVLADGSPGLEAREELFPPLSAGPGAAGPAALEAIEVLCDLGGGGPGFSAAESAALSLAQGRYALTALGGRRAALRIRLAEREAAALAAPADGALEAALAAGGALRPCLLEGLRLFGLPEGTAGAASGLRAAAPPPACRAELRACAAPGDGEVLPHPLAFVVGEAAAAPSLRPGHELDGALRGARSLARQLATMQRCLETGWPVSDRMLAEHDQEMAAARAEEAELCPQRPVLAGRRAAKGRAGEAGQAQFLAAVRDAHARLAGGLPPERTAELGTAEALCEKVSGLGLGAETCRLLGRSGSWLPPGPPDGGGAPLPGAAAAGAGGGATGEAAAQEELAGEAPQAEAGSSPRERFNQGVRLLKAGGEGGAALAAEAFLAAAHQGHREAQYAAGVMLLRGEGLARSERQAARWLTAAAEQNHPKAQYNMGLMRQYGVGLPRDLAAASQWMSYAARQGHRGALRSPLLVTFGAEDWADYDPAVLGAAGVLREAERGNRGAQYRLGAMLYEGDGVEQDKARASFWFMQAAQQGLAEAQYQMSRLLFFGDGVEEDQDYALRFLTLAAEQGHIEAQHNLGVKLYFGEGVGIDRRLAAQWFLRAAKQGFPQAQNNIGWMLVTGDGVDQDISQGRVWLEDAAGRGNIEAQMHISAMEGNVLGV